MSLSTRRSRRSSTGAGERSVDRGVGDSGESPPAVARDAEPARPAVRVAVVRSSLAIREALCDVEQHDPATAGLVVPHAAGDA